MMRMRSHLRIRLSCLWLAVTFVALDISYADPDLFLIPDTGPSTSSLAAWSKFQLPAGPSGEGLSDAGLAAYIIEIADWIYCEGGDISRSRGRLSLLPYYMKTVEGNYPEDTPGQRRSIDLRGVALTDEGAILIPCKSGSKDFLLMVAPKGSMANEDLAGDEWPISDRYLARKISRDDAEDKMFEKGRRLLDLAAQFSRDPARGDLLESAKRDLLRISDPDFRFIGLSESERARNDAMVDLRKASDQRELEIITRTLVEALSHPVIKDDIRAFIDSLLEGRKRLSIRFRIALRLAESKLYVDSLRGKMKIGIVFAVHDVCKNRMMRQAENPKEGEDALRVKIRQLEQLFGDNTDMDWQMTIVDDGSSGEQSGRYAESILREEYPGLYGSGKARVLYLQRAIEENLQKEEGSRDPVLYGMRSQADSRKGGSIEYGMSEAVRSGADYVLYTDSDTSSHLGLIGTALKNIIEGDNDVVLGSRSIKGAILVNRPFTRRIQAWQDTILFNWFAIRPTLPWIKEFKDTQNAFKMFRKDVLKKILPYIRERGFIFDTELLLLSKIAGYRVKEFPMPFVDTPDVTSVSMMDGIKMARQLRKEAGRYRSGEYDAIASHSPVRRGKSAFKSGMYMFLAALFTSSAAFADSVSGSMDFPGFPAGPALIFMAAAATLSSAASASDVFGTDGALPGEDNDPREREPHVMIFGAGSGTSFFDSTIAQTGWNMSRVLTPYDDGEHTRTGRIKNYMKSRYGIDFIAVGDLTKALVEQAVSVPALQSVMNAAIPEGSLTLKEGVWTITRGILLKKSDKGSDSEEFGHFIHDVVKLAEKFDSEHPGFLASQEGSKFTVRHLIFLACFDPEATHLDYSDRIETATRAFMDLIGLNSNKAYLSCVDEDLGTLEMTVSFPRGGEEVVLTGQNIITTTPHDGIVKRFDFALGKRQSANPEVIRAIGSLREGDMAVFGPGSFYTSILANMIPEGMVDAISEAKKRGVITVFVFNPIYENETVYMKNLPDGPLAHMAKKISGLAGKNGKFDDMFGWCIVNDPSFNGDEEIYLMTEEGSKAGNKKFAERPDKFRLGPIEGIEALKGYLAGQDVTVVSGDLMSVKRTQSGSEATYDPDKFAAILKAIQEDHHFSKNPEIAVLSDTHATVDGLLAFKQILKGVPVYHNGDMIDRGDELWKLMKLVDQFTLGDHELWAIGACLGHDYLLALWLRMLYRYPMTTHVLDDMGIDTSELSDFARTRYENILDNNIDLFKRTGAPKNVEEMALFNIWIKIAGAEAGRMEARGMNPPSELKHVLEELLHILGDKALMDRTGLAQAGLTEEEEAVFRSLKEQFLKTRPGREESTRSLASYFLQGRLFQVIRPLPVIPREGALSNILFSKMRKPVDALMLHANIPMDIFGRPVDLWGNPVSLADLKAYYEELNANFAAFEERLKRYDPSGGEFWEGFKLRGRVSDPGEWLMLIADSEYSPLFARRQERVDTYLKEVKEPDNIAYKILTRNKSDADREALNSEGVDAKMKCWSKAVIAKDPALIPEVKKTLMGTYGLSEDDLVVVEGSEDGLPGLYIANEHVNAMIAKCITDAFGVSTIMLGHIARDKKTGKPASLAGGRLWMIDGSFAKKSGNVGLLAAEETGGFLKMSPGLIQAGVLVKIAEVLRNEGDIFSQEKAELLKYITLKDFSYYDGTRLSWEEVSSAPFLMRDLMAVFGIDFQGREVTSLTSEEWNVEYRKFSASYKEKVIGAIRAAVSSRIEYAQARIVQDIARQTDDKIRDRLKKELSNLTGIGREMDTHITKELCHAIVTYYLGLTKDPQVLKRLTCKPNRYLVPVRINGCLPKDRPPFRKLDRDIIEKAVEESMAKHKAGAGHPAATVYDNMERPAAQGIEDPQTAKTGNGPEGLFAIVEAKRQLDLKEGSSHPGRERIREEISAVALLAHKAARDGQKLIIGYEADWVPGMGDPTSLQRQAMSALIEEFDSIPEILRRSFGLNNVILIRERGGRLADALLDTAGKTGTDLSNVIAIASSDTVGSRSFEVLRSTETEERAFISSIDLSGILDYLGSPHDGRPLDVRLRQIFFMTFDLAAGREAVLSSILISYDRRKKIAVFLPVPEPVDYEILRKRHNVEAQALAAA